MRKMFFVLAAFFITKISCAQDPHFSQFYASPLTLNPAYTGKFDGSLRATANYRAQWVSIPNAYSTASGSIDFKLLSDHLHQGNILGLGLSALNDQSADGALKLNYGSLSLAYHKALDGEGLTTLGAGFQATYSNLSINPAKLTFEDQLLGATPVSQDMITIQKNGTSQSYMDLNAGLLFSTSTDGTNNYYAGFSIYHINRPVVGFMGNDWKLNPRFTFHGGGTFPLNEDLAIFASAIEQLQDEASEFVAGGALRYNVNHTDDNPTNVYLGSWYRLNDAIIPYCGLEFSGLRLGFTYDINVSSLKAATQERGGMEFSLIYIVKQATDGSSGIPCPVF